MPAGSANFIAAALILNLKMLLLPRFLWMPGALCYMAASAVETAFYLLGWSEPVWSAAVNVLAVLAAMECSEWALGAQSDAERSAVRRWCWGLGLVFCASQFAAGGVVYPRYPELIYEIRLAATVFSLGYLIALLGYCYANALGTTRYVIHASILLLRLATFGALLLVHDRTLWFTADLIGEAVNILTLCAWLWLLPRRVGMQSTV